MAVVVFLLLVTVVAIVVLVVVFVLVKRRRSRKEIAEGNVGGNTNIGTNNGMGKVFVLLTLIKVRSTKLRHFVFQNNIDVHCTKYKDSCVYMYNVTDQMALVARVC